MGHTYCAHPSHYDLYTRLPREYPYFNQALHQLWGTHWVEAATVSYGEGHWSPYATNGQYRGTFQMGIWARSHYGDSNNLVGQAVAAHALYTASGWAPWECVSY